MSAERRDGVGPSAGGADRGDQDAVNAPDPWFAARRSLVRAAMRAFPSGVGILMLLLTYHGRGSRGCAFPSIKTLLDQSGAKRRTVQRALRHYADAGIIVRESRFGQSTRYQLAGRFAADGRPQQGHVTGDTGDIRDTGRTSPTGDIRDAGGVSTVSPDQKKRTEESLSTRYQQPRIRASAAVREREGTELARENTAASSPMTASPPTPASPAPAAAVRERGCRVDVAEDDKSESEALAYFPDDKASGGAPDTPGASGREPTRSKAMSSSVGDEEASRLSVSDDPGTVLLFPSALPPVDRRDRARCSDAGDAGAGIITPGMPEDGLDDLDLLRLDYVSAFSAKLGTASLSLRADRKPVRMCAQAHAASSVEKPLRDWFREQVAGYLSLNDSLLREKGYPLGFMPYRLGEIAAKSAGSHGRHDSYMDDWERARSDSTGHDGVKKGSAS